MRNITKSVAILSLIVIVTPAQAKKQPTLTPMELQSLQSREFRAPKNQVFSSLVSVFQDMGYQISEADMASGFITAGSANKNKTSFLEAMGGLQSHGATRATAFVEEMPSGLTRARLNFMNTKNSSSGWGRSSSNDKPILEPKTYQVAFERIEQALFERGALTKSAPTPAMVAPVVVPPAVVPSTNTNSTVPTIPPKQN